MMRTFAPLVFIDEIWLACSAAVLAEGAYWTSALKPALVIASVKSFPARTQFSDVLSGRATPMVEPALNPAAFVVVPVSRLEQPERAMSATAATATVVIASLRIIYFLLGCGGAVVTEDIRCLRELRQSDQFGVVDS